MNTSPFVISQSTKLKINTYITNNTNCQSSNVIYCLSCSNCNLQYVGLTTRKIKDRIKEHLYNIHNMKAYNYLYQHFRNCSSDKTISFSILDNLPENADKSILNEKEMFWIKLLNTAYPFGNNDNIRSYGNISHIPNPLTYKSNHPYFCLHITKIHKRSNNRRHRNKEKHINSINDFINFMETNPDLQSIRQYLYQMKKKYINQIIYKCHTFDFLENITTEQKHYLLCLLCKFHFNSIKNSTSKKKPFKYSEYCNLKINYIHTMLDKINLNKILNNNKIRTLISSNSKIKYIPFRVTYIYSPPVCTKIFNYNYTLKNLTNSHIKEIMSQDCVCSLPHYENYINPHYGHIISGDLSIINDTMIRNILSKGTKYCVQQHVNKDTILNWINELKKFPPDYYIKTPPPI